MFPQQLTAPGAPNSSEFFLSRRPLFAAPLPALSVTCVVSPSPLVAAVAFSVRCHCCRYPVLTVEMVRAEYQRCHHVTKRPRGQVPARSISIVWPFYLPFFQPAPSLLASRTFGIQISAKNHFLDRSFIIGINSAVVGPTPTV